MPKESVVAQPTLQYPSLLRKIDFAAVRIWILAGGLVLYLALDGGGYDIVVHSQVSIVVWWIVLIAAAWGLLPAARLTPAAWWALGLLGGFVAWTALATTWSISSERSLQALSLDAGYLGVLVIGIAVHRDREHALRHTIGAVASAIVVVAVVALASRLHPGLFTSASQTASYLPGAESRLSWPLNYWNALAALLAFSVPLLLSLTATARSVFTQALAAAAIPLVAVSGYLTFSRGGLIALAASTIIYYLLVPDRLPKLLTGAVAGAASAALIAGCVHRDAIERGILSATARHQGSDLILPIILACAGVALAQAAIGLAVRHGRRPPALVVSRRQATAGLAVAAVAVVLVALAAGAPHRLSHAWQDFKRPSGTGLGSDTIQRFGVASGNGRYDYWKAAVNSNSGGHLLTGHGPGTFQFLWLPRAPYTSYVQNAHSLYFETFAETGLVGLALLVGFLVLVLVQAVRLVVRTAERTRTRAAGVAAALVAFAISAGTDWVWQVPVIPTAFILVAATVLIPSRRAIRDGERGSTSRSRSGSDRQSGSGRHAKSNRRWLGSMAVRVGVVVLAVLCTAAIGVPLAMTNALRRSQAAAAAGNLTLALSDARTAARVESGAGSPQVQEALVLESQGKPRQALAPALRAVHNEPDNWSSWLILSRLQAEAGNPTASVAAYRQARSLNPKSKVFRAARVSNALLAARRIKRARSLRQEAHLRHVREVLRRVARQRAARLAHSKGSANASGP
jgi:O-Antigen ligase